MSTISDVNQSRPTTESAKTRSAHGKGAEATPLRTLAIDIGGSGLKASLLDEQGEMVSERIRVETPHPCPPEVMVETLAKLIEPLGAFDRVSVGFPGVVRKGTIVTAHNLGQDEWKGFDLREALAARLGKPVQVKNDADVQGLGAIRGVGIEMVITLGTGFGTALFDDGWIAPHIELAHHPFRKGQSYEEQLGARALRQAGHRKWQRRVKRAIKTLRHLTHFDRLYIGGGNSRLIDIDLPADVEVISNDVGMRGGIWLWRKDRPHMTCEVAQE
ncbi:MAG TPA: ROK family protein [Pirellulales bacterium]|nr:ROK family protein [Pirellulales bacterium]